MSSWYESLKSAIVARSFVPQLTNPRIIRRLVDSHESPAEAWESLFARGHIPLSWAASSSRHFELYDGSTPWSAWLEQPHAQTTHPPTLDGCFYAAAAMASLVTAEQIAFDMVRQLNPEAPIDRVVWVIARTPPVIPTALLGFERLHRATRLSIMSWSQSMLRKRSMRDKSARRRALAKAEWRRRDERADSTSDRAEALSIFDEMMNDLLAKAELAESEYVRVSRSTFSFDDHSMSCGEPLQNYYSPLRALLELLSLGVSIGPFQHGCVYLVLRG